MRLNHIVCTSKNWVIGRDGDMPWHLPEDLKHFKKTTMGCPVIMGRKTFESIGRALPGRLNIVLTRNSAYEVPAGVEVVSTMEEGINLASEHQRTNGGPEELFIIGGGELYKQTMDMIDRVYLTRIHREIDGDTLYGPFDEEKFKLIEKEDLENESEKFSFLTYDRNNIH